MTTNVDPKLQNKLAQLRDKRNHRALPTEVVNTREQMLNLKQAVIVDEKTQSNGCFLFSAGLSLLAIAAVVVGVFGAVNQQDEPEIRYWMNEDTGKVISTEDSPGHLWFEIDFSVYYALTHIGAKPMADEVQS